MGKDETPEWESVDAEATASDTNLHDQSKDDSHRDLDNDPFGNEENKEVKYRTMKWWHCGMLMIAVNISLGILSLPSAVATLGIAPTAILIVFLSGISWYTGFVIGQFKLRHPHVHSMGDAGEILMGRVGREILGTGQLLLLIFLMSSHLLTFTILMNTLTMHGTCTTVFGVVGLIVCFLGALPRTMGKVYWMSVASFASIFIATVVTMVSIGVEADGTAHNDVVRETSFYKGFLAVTNIIFAYIAHATFFGFVSETEDPRTFPKSLAMLQIVDTVMYLVTAMVIYHYAGPDVKSPALSSAGPLMKKICYGLAIPTVIVSGVVEGHVACKYIYVRVFRGSDHMHQRSFLAIGSWVGIGLAVWTVAWIIAESIPVFNDLLSLISSLFGSMLCYAFPALFWLHMNRGQYFSTLSKGFLTFCNLSILAIAFGICGMGLYVSGRAINESSEGGSWSCADNS
ncbi:hypothetical protein N7452_009971 [Penicillium brevicompactum]|uniref:Amino acid transporter transmembrane domain-containing protein n=1 Tax=Penicillium brevicompactum TaxID=5074 RepID=A0A9W9Q9M0_PENBR|nr:hypothetical protein N7452_009971 [Penicillium brevicompactum]